MLTYGARKIMEKYPKSRKCEFGEKYVLNSIYYCAYWDKCFKVINIGGDNIITSEWDDGHITRHCTPLRDNDIEIKE